MSMLNKTVNSMSEVLVNNMIGNGVFRFKSEMSETSEYTLMSVSPTSEVSVRYVGYDFEFSERTCILHLEDVNQIPLITGDPECFDLDFETMTASDLDAVSYSVYDHYVSNSLPFHLKGKINVVSE